MWIEWIFKAIFTITIIFGMLGLCGMALLLGWMEEAEEEERHNAQDDMDHRPA